MNDLLQNWVKTVKTNDANQVAELYHDNGLLLGTFSNKERNGKSLILEYFKKLLKSKVDVEIITQHEHKTNTILVSSGLYNFIVNDVKIKARYTFVFSNIKNNWKILSHHSSILTQSAEYFLRIFVDGESQFLPSLRFLILNANSSPSLRLFFVFGMNL